MSSDEKPNGDSMENEVKEEEMETGAKDEKEDQKDEKDGGDKEGEDDDEEEEDESSEEELPLGSVEAPVQIMTGKRDRKKVERLVMKETPKTPEKKFVVPVGKGVKLGEIPIVVHFLEKTKALDLKPLHKFLFGRIVRDPRETKRNIKQFSGFEFTKDDREYGKREASLCKFTMEGIKEICTILDVEKKGTKDVIMDRILEFCMNPQPSGRQIPEKGKKKGKSKAAGKKKKTKKQKGKGKKGGGDASTGTEEDGDTTMDDGTEGDAEGDGGDTSMTEGESKPKKKRKPKTPKPKKEASKPKSSPKKKKMSVKAPSSKQSKKSSPVKSPKKTPKKRNHDDIDDDSSDEEPLMKKVKAPPTDKQIKETVKEILEGANLEEVTMKMVCRKVYDTYPQHPLQHKKDFIKSTVREIIS